MWLDDRKLQIMKNKCLIHKDNVKFSNKNNIYMKRVLLIFMA